MTKPVAFVTGAANQTGIGFAIAERFLQDGYRVVISDLADRVHDGDPHAITDDSTLAETRDVLGQYGEVLAVRCDVRHESEVDSAIGATLEAFGGLDVLVNNAGLGAGLGPAVDLTLEDWQLNLDVMATGVFLCSRAAARVMLDAERGGRIITVASQAAKSGFPFLAAYSAAKFATIGLTQALAHELGPAGITVNAVCPGTIDTELNEIDGGMFDVYSKAYGVPRERYRERIRKLIPLHRFGAPHEVAEVVAFLASDAASFVTGEAVNVTGGQVMH